MRIVDRMDWAQLAWTCLACAGLLLAGGAVGYAIAHSRTADTVANAKSAADVCQSASEAQLAKIDKLQDYARKNLMALAAERDIAHAMMAQRDKLQYKLNHRPQQQARKVTEVAHAHADCSSLARLPVCPAVARQLWPALDTHGDAAGDH